ncbi:helix-turn-helix domain-containing protein [uncultured Ruminococcus sp.]|uniref:helix-turn-helix domain-containing protein n=1 Tax=uncultured Ruminococcus sp. TaxID=165186 RepID=UPI002931D009|nr:helix-turn-helix domain-containing protein [uncultured Ruminococcus sp.]
MNMLFADTLKKLRTEKRLSQNDIAKRMYVTPTTVSRWESGHRLPDAAMIARLSDVLGVNVNILISAAAQSDESPIVIMVDDNKVFLNDGMPIIEEVIPNAAVIGFTKPSEAVEYAKANRIALAFLDIEMIDVSGLDVCRKLLEINQRTNVVYLTAYRDYSFDAWDTGAIGFMVKPLTADGVKKQLKKLRYPFLTGGEES